VDEKETLENQSIRPNEGLTSKVLLSGKSLLVIPSQQANNEIQQAIGPAAESWLGVPLIARGETIGVMAVQNYSDANAYSIKDLQTLEFVASQVATAIDRKRNEEAVRTIEQRNSALIEHAPDGIVLLDKKGRFTYGSPTSFAFRYSSEDTLGQLPLNGCIPMTLNGFIPNLYKHVMDPSKTFAVNTAI
jgi:hypothetical protein